ncbi:uncharacterized protein BX664DRAFT_324566 [Halteromyces radiatus]|uniref:uncharacterized protein n=1 Tax=Halteromyces radiatus TaxID=101107 RepID=UPI00221EC36E|nr:uncharacterized protein BX664DRAFT_324566 [Halteromyces radiatus]KAI8096666.1 hypothetical protein BX664DRAFT_324566 [Halteromyces radiatus]
MTRLSSLLLSFIFSFSLIFISQADPINELDAIHQLIKREDKLPFDTLPNANCTAPSACQNIAQPASCRCNGVLTVCQNNQGQFCWGSQSLNQNTGCPTVPSTCSSSFNGTASCLCNSQAVLCVDQHNHYCYGNVAAGSSVSLAPIPTGSQTSSSSAQIPLPPAASGGQSSSPGASSTPSLATTLTISSQQIILVLVLALVSLASIV